MRDERLEQFAEDLHQEVLAKAGGLADEAQPSTTLLREEMFTEAVLETLESHNEADGWELCSSEGKSIGSLPAAKLSAWSLSGDGATLDLFVSLYHGTGKVVEVGKPEIRRQFELVLGFLKRALGGFHTRMEEASLGFVPMQRIHAARDSLAGVRLFVLTDGVARSLDITPEKVPGIDVKYVAWDLEKLSRLHAGSRAVIELDLKKDYKDYGGNIPCLQADDGTGEYRTFLAFFPAPLLARIYGEYGQRLLERNVRAFLQTKGKVNKGLQTTLRETPNRFLAYNNGLCCTAAEVRLAGEQDRTGEAPTLTWLRDFQIVNGGQTTASIFHAIKKEKRNLDEVKVQVKLTVLSKPETASEMVPEISRCANSQNKVNGADFAANGKFHRDLEELSRTIWAPAMSGMERGTHWYYERARGSYLDDKSRQGTRARQNDWARQNPPSQKFTKTDLAKFEHAWLGLPHLVCKGAEKNFAAFAERLEDDAAPEVDRDFFECVVARDIIWRTTEKAFDGLDLLGYRAQSIAYAIAWIAERSNRRIDLGRIWKEQKVPEGLARALTKASAEAHAFLELQSGNIGEASKRPDTWSEFRIKDFDVGDDLKELVTTKPIVPYTEQKPSAKGNAARKSIGEITANQWFALSKWAKDHSFLEGWERSITFSLGKIVARGGAPSEKQAIQGARIAERARELGFSFEEPKK